MFEFAYELKKLMFRLKGLVYMSLVLLLGIFWLFALDSPYDNAMEQYRNEYEWYLEKTSGYCTNEKALYLEQEAQRITDAKTKQNNILESYYDGAISKSEYEKENEEIVKILEHQNGFEVIYQQYLYICENTENRYFLQTNGWAGLLSGNTLNFVLFLGILLLVTPVFCSEYSCQMDALILTSKEGQKSALYKILIAVAGVFLLCVTLSLMEYGFYSIKYGLPNGDYPIQSLSYFADSSKDITLFEGYICIGLLRCFGGIFLAIFLMLISVLAKKYSLTLFLGAASVLIPYIGLSKTYIYRLPFPLPFLLGTDFFAGDIVFIDDLTGDEKFVFAEVDTVILLVLLLVSVLLCAFAVIWILRRNSNRWQLRSGKRRSTAAITIMMSLLLAITGCSNNHENQSVVYNSSADYNCGEYKVIQDAETLDYYLENISTGKTFDLVRSPVFNVFSDEGGVFSDNEKAVCYYLCSPYLYYTTLVTERYVNRVGNYNSSVTKVSVVELNLDTFEEKTIFEQITNSGRSLLGIDYETGDKWSFLELHHSFFLNEDSLFFVDGEGITEVNRTTKDIVKLDIPTNGNISFDGENIYYKNEQSVLTKYNTSTNDATLYEDIIAYDFCIDEKSIYYISRTDGSIAYSCDKEGNNKRIINDNPAIAVTCDIDNIYISEKQNGKEISIPKMTD